MSDILELMINELWDKKRAEVAEKVSMKQLNKETRGIFRKIKLFSGRTVPVTGRMGSVGREIIYVCLVLTEKLTRRRMGIRMGGGVRLRDRHGWLFSIW